MRRTGCSTPCPGCGASTLSITASRRWTGSRPHRVHPVDQIVTKSASLIPVFALGFSEVAIGLFAFLYHWQSLLHPFQRARRRSARCAGCSPRRSSTTGTTPTSAQPTTKTLQASCQSGTCCSERCTCRGDAAALRRRRPGAPRLRRPARLSVPGRGAGGSRGAEGDHALAEQARVTARRRPSRRWPGSASSPTGPRCGRRPRRSWRAGTGRR